jgi:hypothetical protein
MNKMQLAIKTIDPKAKRMSGVAIRDKFKNQLEVASNATPTAETKELNQ